MRTLVFLTLLAGSTTAIAQEAEREVTYRKVTLLDIDEDLSVTADLFKPSGTIFHGNPRGEFNPLIELRTHFGDEMVRSLDAVK